MKTELFFEQECDKNIERPQNENKAQMLADKLGLA